MSSALSQVDSLLAKLCGDTVSTSCSVDPLELAEVSSNRCFGGVVKKFEHKSAVLGGLTARFSVFLPTTALSAASTVPVLLWLSGLTCTEDNFMWKAGAQRRAAARGVALLCPDTSPRGCDFDDDSYDFGSGAGFYVNATAEPWKKHYQMYDYVNSELWAVVAANSELLPLDTSRVAVFGHSMGGHGALVCYLRNPSLYASVSAFAPVCNPCQCRWGQKCFGGYLGDDRKQWPQYDATELLRRDDVVSALRTDAHIRIEQGAADQFLAHGRDAHNQLRPEEFKRAADRCGLKVDLRWRKGYDHSYFFIASFIDEHIDFHSDNLAVV